MSKCTLAIFVLCLAMNTAHAAEQTPPPAPPVAQTLPPARPVAQTPPPAPPAAQTPPPAPPAAQTPPAPPAAPRPEGAPRTPEPPQPVERPTAGQPVNIRLDIAIIDEGGPQASRKAVSLTVADRQSGQVRTTVYVPDIGQVPLSVDALPILDGNNRVRARVTLEYQPNPGADRKLPSSPSMRLSFGIVLENGRKIVAAQAADPVSDRHVTVEITATVLK